MRRRIGPLSLVAAALAAGCGDDVREPDPGAGVRAAASEYVDALREERWAEACDRMTTAARAAVADGGRSCARALRGGGALPPAILDSVKRGLAGAPVRVGDGDAELGPVADLPAPLRFERRDGRWLLAR